MSQISLADKLGVRRTYLSQVENGRKQASLDLLRKASELLGVPLALLVAWDDRTRVHDDEKEIFGEMQRLFAHLLSARIEAMKTEGEAVGQPTKTAE